MDLKPFANGIWKLVYDNMPFNKSLTYDLNPSGSKKHPNREGHMRDFALGDIPNSISLPNGSYCFEIGNEEAEKDYPHYHILEDAQVISKKNRATKRTSGSQASVQDRSQRDYGKITRTISINKKTGEVRANRNGGVKYNYYQEYRKNVRGKRSLIGKAKVGDSASRYYPNIHYHYIERTLDNKLDFMCQDYGLKMKTKAIIESLETDYLQEHNNNAFYEMVRNIGEINYFGNK